MATSKLMWFTSNIGFVFVWMTLGYCQSCITTEDSPSKSTPNTPCIFPFVYKNQSFNGCTEDKKGFLWCSTKVDTGTNAHVKDNWGFCSSSCDKSCAHGQTCKLKDECPEINAEFQRYKAMRRNAPERAALREKLKSLVCRKKPNKFCCKIPPATTIATPTAPIPQRTSNGGRKSIFPRSCQKEPTTNFDGNKLPRTGRCGVSCNTDVRVVNGENAKLAEFPWAALLGYQSVKREFDFILNKQVTKKYVKYKCGGTLINTWYVLTAAHCHSQRTKHKRVYQVVLGEWEVGGKNENKDPDCPPKGECLPNIQKILVDKVVIHEEYRRESNGIFKDIALVRLKTEAVLNYAVQLACLPLNTANMAKQIGIKDFGDGLGDYTGTVIGWGHTENNDAGDFEGANVAKSILQKAKLPIWTMRDCQNNKKKVIITENHLCAGGAVDGADSCKGDSGGGIFIRKNTSDTTEKKTYGYVQVGLVSFGSTVCGNGSPGIYTRVSQYISWIYQIIKP